MINKIIAVCVLAGLSFSQVKQPPHRPLTDEGVLQIQDALAQDVCTYTEGTSEGDSCPTLPLGIIFSDYTIQLNGSVLQDGGWTQAERDWLMDYFCKAMPIINDNYGDPYQFYDLKIVKDLRYASSNIFIPSTLSIHSASALPPGWYPQLWVHELIHAWRSVWTITADPTVMSLYSPKLSGFEEGFAQGISYNVMNDYTAAYGSNDPHVGFYYWSSDFDWDYDFRNDLSMTTENFWSEVGGTWKYWERYEMSAAAIRRLDLAITNFAPRFNEAWYIWVDAQLPSYIPSRSDVIDLIVALEPTIAGQPTADWIDDQRIFDQQYIFGKKYWFLRPLLDINHRAWQIFMIETFPSGSEWIHYVQSLNNYLLHRFNYEGKHFGHGRLIQNWNNLIIKTFRINNQDLTYWPPKGYACYINCAQGFGYDVLLLYVGTPPTLPYYGIENPIFIPLPRIKGLYRINAIFQNPHFGQTIYGIPYDLTQTSANATAYGLIGFTDAEYLTYPIMGGFKGFSSGTLEIEHTSFAGIVDTVQVANGAFITAGKPEWFRSVLNGTFTIFEPGELIFRFTPSGSQNTLEFRKIVDGGTQWGKHHFLF